MSVLVFWGPRPKNNNNSNMTRRSGRRLALELSDWLNKCSRIIENNDGRGDQEQQQQLKKKTSPTFDILPTDSDEWRWSERFGHHAT